jgi:HD superfamily phosphohydrolase YqeK
MAAGALPSWAVVSPARLAHIERVAALAQRWAGAMGVPAAEGARWLRAVWLHDALRDAPVAELRHLAPDDPGNVELLHGPAAAERAAAEGEKDAGVLTAVRWHSVGHEAWDGVGRTLFCADYLEPGRTFDRERRAELAERFPAAPDEVFRAVLEARLLHTVRSGWPLLPSTVRLWNSLR